MAGSQVVKWVDTFPSVTNSSDPQIGLPRKLLRHLFSPRHVEVGSRVLDVRNRDARLTPFLDFLGFEATEFGISEPRLAIHGTPVSERTPLASLAETPFPQPERDYDLVLARNLDEYQHDLCSLQTISITANLLSCLRPRGRMVILVRTEPSWDNAPDGHLRSCYARHFSCFPGLCQVCYFPDGFSRPQTWKWIAGLQPRSGYLVASFSLDDESRTRAEWQGLARKQNRHPQETCCLWARRHSDAVANVPLKKAA